MISYLLLGKSSPCICVSEQDVLACKLCGQCEMNTLDLVLI